MTAYTKDKKIFDILFIVFILFIAYNIHTSIMETSYNGAILHSSDADGNACFMAGNHEPSLFQHDALLKENCSVISYTTSQNFIAHIFKTIYPTATYGTAILITQGATIFLYFFNFYILGIFLNLKRSISAIMALSMGITMWVGYGTYWGITYETIIPRAHYAVIFPLLIIAAYKLSDSYKKRILLSIILALSVYIHSLNSIGIAAGVFFYFLLSKCSKISNIKHIIHTAVCFGIYITSLLMFMMPLVSLHHTNLNNQNLSVFREIYALRQNDYDGFFNIFYEYICSYWYIFVLAIVCSYFIYIYCDKKQQIITKQFFFYSLGIIIASVVVYLLDSYISEKFNLIPRMEQLPRVLRFLLPFSIIIISIVVNSLTDNLNKCIYIPFVSLMLFLTQYAYIHDPLYKIMISNNFKNISIFNSIYEETSATLKYEKLLHEALDEAKRTIPSNEQIFTNKDYLPLRHYSLKNIAYSWKDGTTIMFRRNCQDAAEWISIFKRMKKSSDEYINIWKEKNIKWLFTDRISDIERIENLGGKLIWNNSQFAILSKI